MPTRSLPATTVGATAAQRGSSARGDLYWLRLPATGLCFVVFGLAALILGLLVLPPLGLLARDREVGRRRARTVIAGGMRAFVYFMRAVGVMRYSFEGREHLGKPGQMIIANHPTLIDVLFLLGFTPNATCIVKHALFQNPFTRGALRAADYIPNSPTDEMVLRAEQELRQGQCLVIFPEGTRTTPARPLELQRGAANMALRGARQLTPVFIHCEPPTLSKHEPWYRIPAQRAEFSLRVGEDIELAPYRRAPLPRGSRELNAHLKELFEAAGAGRELS